MFWGHYINSQLEQVMIVLIFLYFLQKHGVDQAQEAIQGSGLMQLLVRKCSKGTGFSKMWLLRDLEILSIMLYSSKREIHSMAEDADTETDERRRERKSMTPITPAAAEDADPNRPDPLEGLDEETKICFQVRFQTHLLPVVGLFLLSWMIRLIESCNCFSAFRNWRRKGGRSFSVLKYGDEYVEEHLLELSCLSCC